MTDNGLQNIALVVRFLLELGLLAGAAILAWRVTEGGWRWVAAIGAVVFIATIWGLFLSPKATVSLPDVAVLAIESVLFLGVGTGLLLVGFGVPAVIGVVIWIVDRIALGMFERS